MSGDSPSILPEPEAKPEFVREGFDRIAERYDLLNDLMTWGMHRRWKREAIRLLALSPGARMLDLCAGTGDLARIAARVVGPNGLVVALDFAPRMIVTGRKRAERESDNPLIWIRGDALALPFRNSTFDGAAVGFGLRNIAALDTALIEVHRVLKPGARFVSLDTARTEWKHLAPLHRLYMRYGVPFLGGLLAGSTEMYRYLAESAETFHDPETLERLFREAGFHETGHRYRPRIAVGAALVWGRK